ncbi:MAG: hypothetical protein U0T75_13385 [Chitinophagales bacterium]
MISSFLGCATYGCGFVFLPVMTEEEREKFRKGCSDGCGWLVLIVVAAIIAMTIWPR